MALTDEDKAYFESTIAEARRILRDDKVLGKLNKHFPDETEPDTGDDDQDGPKPPPKRNEPKNHPEPRARGWWPREETSDAE
jgi:hypothetical protein